MARKKISQLESAVDVTANDLVQIVDVEDGDMAPSGTNKKATAQLLANELGKLTNVTATGSTTARSLANRFADVVNVKDFGDEDGIGDVTLNVPSQYPTIQAALDYLLTKRINNGSTVIIKVADGTYNVASTINIYHLDGMSIKILGNTSNPALCVLNFTTSGFMVFPGRSLLEINGFTINSTIPQSNATATLGILASGGIINRVGPNIVVNNFYYGISAWHNGYINCGGVKVTNSGDCGIWSFIGSHIICDDAEVSGSNDSANGLGGGIVAEFGSSIQANRVYTHDNWLAGICCISNSAIRAWSSKNNNNGKHGIFVGSGGRVEIFGTPPSEIKDNGEYGVFCPDSDGLVYGIGQAVSTGNVLGVERNGFVFSSNGSTLIQSGSVTVNADNPAQVTNGDTYVDLRCQTDKFNIIRFLENDTEKARIQYDSLNGILLANGEGKNGFRFFTSTGKTTIGSGGPSTTQTTGIGIQIPAVNGAPTGTVTDVQSGYAPLVYDTQNNRLYVWNAAGTPAWKMVTLS